MVDYSKFDHIGSSDEDEDASTRRRGAPNVVKLEGAHRITFGGGRDAVAAPMEAPPTVATVAANVPTATVSPVDDADEEVMISEREFARTLEAQRATAAALEPPTVSNDGGSVPTARDWSVVTRRLMRNGGCAREGDGENTERYFWCQDAKEVTLSVVAPPGTRARDVRVRVTATDVEVVLPSNGTDSSRAFREAWTHEIDPEPRDDDDDDGAAAAPTFGDWEITDFEGTGADARRVVRVTVRKKGADMLAHWWRSGVKGGPEVDPATFVDRSSSKAAEARRAWEQAQEMFRERVKNRELIEVDAHDDAQTR